MSLGVTGGLGASAGLPTVPPMLFVAQDEGHAAERWLRTADVLGGGFQPLGLDSTKQIVLAVRRIPDRTYSTA